eukprot:scaffold370_cov349-Pavlova_lutheri.AAC.43
MSQRTHPSHLFLSTQNQNSLDPKTRVTFGREQPYPTFGAYPEIRTPLWVRGVQPPRCGGGSSPPLLSGFLPEPLTSPP